jgi:PTH1 family peptidyl-tRNA hydrolase
VKRFKKSESFLLVGLGNPDPNYINNRHNIGFRTIDYISQSHKISVSKHKKNAFIGSGLINNTSVILAKPTTYMNLSGEAVRKLISFFKIEQNNLFIIYDDMDIPLGQMKIKKYGSSAGHKGIQSIIDHIGTDQFIRFKLGIGKPISNIPIEKYVLNDFDEEELKKVDYSIKRCGEALIFSLRNEIDRTMNDYNKKVIYES